MLRGTDLADKMSQRIEASIVEHFENSITTVFSVCFVRTDPVYAKSAALKVIPDTTRTPGQDMAIIHH